MQKRCAIILCALLCAASPAKADNIQVTYTGDGIGLWSTPGSPSVKMTYLYPQTDAAHTPSVSHNRVTVNYVPGTGKIDPDTVYGGWTNTDGVASEHNVVTLTSGKILSRAYGGASFGSTGGRANNNTLAIASDVTVGGVVAAGCVTNGTAYENTLTLSGKAQSRIHGGIVGIGTAYNNEVIINGGESTDTVYGGRSDNSTAKSQIYKNTVTITNGKAVTVFGGHVVGSESTAKNNTVAITGSTVSNVTGGATSGGEASGNKITITNSEVGDATGAYSSDGEAKNNTVTVNGTGTIVHSVKGAYSETNDASQNTVTVKGGAIRDGIWGGEGVNAKNNTVIMKGGKVFSVIGGLASATGSATNNTVDFYDGTVTHHLVGGMGANSTGNTLNMRTSGKTVKYLAGFQNYNFYLPSGIKKNAVVLTVTNGDLSTTRVGGPVKISKAKVSVGLQNGKHVLAKGDKVTLIDSAVGFDTSTVTKGKGLKGIATTYEFEVAVKKGMGTQQLLVATVTDSSGQGNNGGGDAGSLNPRVKSILEGSLGSVALVGQGGEVVAGQGMRSAVSAAKATAAVGAGGPIAFGTLGGGFSRYNTGSHVKVESVNFLAGLGWNLNLNEGRNGSLLAGVFFETGFGGYDSHNSFSNDPSVHGTGDTRYFGGGLLGRYTMPVGLYAEGSVRAGKVKNEYKAKDLYSGDGRRADYDTSAAYFGAHGGLGYLWQFKESTGLDLYTQYIWTHQNSDKVNIAGDRFSLDDVNSHRWRTGARLTHDVELKSGVVTSPYVGAAFDYEFGGRQKGSVNGRKIDSPTLKGGTGMGELGLSFKPSAASRLSFDMAVQGYTGTREGVSGSLNMKYEF